MSPRRKQNLIALNAQVGVATAEFYPTFTLTGTAGFESISASHLLDWRSKVASIGPERLDPDLRGWPATGQILDAAKAPVRAGCGRVPEQVLIAYGEVEDALTDLHSVTDEVARLRAAVRGIPELSEDRAGAVQPGLSSVLIVIDAERTL